MESTFEGSTGRAALEFLSTFGGPCQRCLHLHMVLESIFFLPLFSFVFRVQPDAGNVVFSLLSELAFPFLVTRQRCRRHDGEQGGENLMMKSKHFSPKILPPAQDVQTRMRCKPREVFSSPAFPPV